MASATPKALMMSRIPTGGLLVVALGALFIGAALLGDGTYHALQEPTVGNIVEAGAGVLIIVGGGRIGRVASRRREQQA